ncbi:uncharacterized protein SOCE26_004180 [Sorangium cellulosum]|uniref:Uncharacterized protein n=1 Tax=Sorangium cellulosum TaxID=56 RepID=A0A2L0EIC2_SORCE|nr:uncharacterized protein SOCE26_004180 [Sorangium cellulosum]
MAQELLRSLQRRGEPLTVWIGRGDSLRNGSPLGLLGQALRGAAGVLGGEPLDAIVFRLFRRRGRLRCRPSGRPPPPRRPWSRPAASPVWLASRVQAPLGLPHPIQGAALTPQPAAQARVLGPLDELWRRRRGACALSFVWPRLAPVIIAG